MEISGHGLICNPCHSETL